MKKIQHGQFFILKPDEGKKLIPKYYNDIKSLFIGSIIYLGKEDSPDNWTEITEEEAVKLEEKRNAAINIDNRLYNL